MIRYFYNNLHYPCTTQQDHRRIIGKLCFHISDIRFYGKQTAMLINDKIKGVVQNVYTR